MITVRPLYLALPLLLTGCGTLSHFSLSSLSPMNWFGSSLTVSETGVGGITAGTSMSEAELDRALDGNYRLRGGMAMHNGKLMAFYEALKDDQVKVTINGEPKRHVSQVDVMDASAASVWGVKIGDEFSSLYSKAFEACQLGQGDSARDVECVAPQSKHVSYLFTGRWSGPDGLMPPDDILQRWKVSKIIWHAQPRS
ncbi:RpoE-regulated lipoprotein [Lonsdalea quercina]|uniref:RpoE-regulated lipoprotein n=1 Tax=Lonsdalea quercina TaxID=71657 RepID=UPI003974876A